MKLSLKFHYRYYYIVLRYIIDATSRHNLHKGINKKSYVE